jgi:hypothetical protein
VGKKPILQGLFDIKFSKNPKKAGKQRVFSCQTLLLCAING